jgi:hypothetical protein
VDHRWRAWHRAVSEAAAAGGPVRRQADFCRAAGSPLTADLLDGAAAELDDADSATSDLLRPLEDDPPGSVPALRFAGALHRLVLERRAPALAVHYPSVGGTLG